MIAAQWIVNLAGLATITWVVWCFWLYRKETVQAALLTTAQQVIRDRDHIPEMIMVRAGTPVRLNYPRQGSSRCGEMGVFDRIDRTAKLPEGETLEMTCTSGRVSEIPLQCQMDIPRGKVVVE